MDGRRCAQDAKIRMSVQSESFMMRMQKPSSLGSGKRIQIVLQAEGEHALMVGYSMRATHISASSHAASGSVSNTSLEWGRLDNWTFSFYGLHMVWDRPPSADAQLDLNANEARFAVAKAFVVEFATECHGAWQCMQDGDTFETVLSIVARSDPTDLQSAVSVTTVVESLLSCKYSRVWVEADVSSVPQSSAIRVRLEAYDVDNLPIAQTRADVEFRFDGQGRSQAVPVQWSRGSNMYTADVPADLTRNSGEYNLTVTVTSAWTRSGSKASCVLFHRTIIVKVGLSSTWILVGAGATAVAIVGGLVLLVRKRHAHLQAVMAMLLTEMGMLVFAICTALTNLVTDGIVFGRLLRGELIVSTEMYMVAYATILCFGVVVTALSLGYRIRNACLMKAQLQQLAPQGQTVAASSASAARRQLQQNEWELVQTHRTKVTLSLSLMTVAAHGARALYGMRACACNPRGWPLAAFCRPADVCFELLPDLRRGQHRQDGARRRPRAWARRPPFNAHAVSCGRSSRRFRSRWCSWASSSAR